MATESPLHADTVDDPLDPIEQISWNWGSAGSAMNLLARTMGLSETSQQHPQAILEERSGGNSLPDLAGLADSRGLEVTFISTSCKSLERTLSDALPLILPLSDDRRFLVLLKTRGRHLICLGQNSEQRAIPTAEILNRMAPESDSNGPSEPVPPVLHDEKSERKLRTARDHLQRQNRSLDLGWMITRQPAMQLKQQLLHTDFLKLSASHLVVHIGQFVCWIASWYFLAQAILDEPMRSAWLIFWLLALVSAFLLGTISTWLMQITGILLGSESKVFLLQSALRMNNQNIRRTGLGELIARMLDANAFDALAKKGGINVGVASVELVLAAILILATTGWSALAWVFLAVLSALVVWCRLYYLRYTSWQKSKLGVTATHTEEMVGHRTRQSLIGQRELHDQEDTRLSQYVRDSRTADAVLVNIELIPRCWLLSAVLVVFVLSFSSTQSGLSTVTLAVLIGIVLLTYRSLQTLCSGAQQLMQGIASYQRINEFCADLNETDPADSDAASGLVANPEFAGNLEVNGIGFGYRESQGHVLRHCDFKIPEGDRSVLSGASGGGKSTLASILSGRIRADEGSVMIGGLDRPSIGIHRWRSLVRSVPQANYNHLISDSLAFNLLMGRNWPPSREDIREAEELCHELGLGAMLGRMPAGIMQFVGEQGWRMSQGEQARVYLARSLLQSPEMLVLDEPLAALDPATANETLNCLERRASRLMLIAHP